MLHQTGALAASLMLTCSQTCTDGFAFQEDCATFLMLCDLGRHMAGGCVQALSPKPYEP